MANTRICLIPGCGNTTHSNGACSAHYSRWKSGLHPDLEEKLGRLDLPRCAVECCDRPACKKGWCERHYRKFLKYGAPNVGRDNHSREGKCAIDDCRRPIFAKRLCGPHYWRISEYGDASAGGTFVGEPMAWILEHLSWSDEDACLRWPFATMCGYAKIRHQGEARSVSRIICEVLHGPAPTTKHEAAHNCGKGHEGCVNPHHLRWATSKENDADKVRHGTIMRGEAVPASKLTAQQVLEIRDIWSKDAPSQRVLAKEFGVSQTTISVIVRRKNWAWL